MHDSIMSLGDTASNRLQTWNLMVLPPLKPSSSWEADKQKHLKPSSWPWLGRPARKEPRSGSSCSVSSLIRDPRVNRDSSVYLLDVYCLRVPHSSGSGSPAMPSWVGDSSFIACCSKPGHRKATTCKRWYTTSSHLACAHRYLVSSATARSTTKVLNACTYVCDSVRYGHGCTAFQLQNAWKALSVGP